MKKILLLAGCFFCLTIVSFGFDSKQFWNMVSETPAMKNGERQIVPDTYLTYSLDVPALKNMLAAAPMEFTSAAQADPVIITLPMPDGTFMDFAMVESPIMQEGLAVKYPFLKTYAGQGITNPSSWVRIDFTLFGFHALVRTAEDDIYIDPYSQQTTAEYLVYYRKDLTNSPNRINCQVADEDVNGDAQRAIQTNAVQRSIASNLRTYRLALACTGEYAAYFGGTVAGALSGMVTSINRVTGVYESELDIRLTLIANTDTLIFLNATTDPYNNNDGSAMLAQNQTTVTARIGSAYYDIGHVFSTGGGGIAGLGVVCVTGQKARGVTGSPAPSGDAFDIDYVAHEMGHQFGGNHTFNSTVGSCGGGNRAASAAYEPGSGVTIMAYAGICGSDNLANNSIAYFHTKSFDEIVIYSTNGNGNTCPVNTLTGNNAPYVTPGGTYNVPVGTAFQLNGTATDQDGDPLTYSWEQFDLGAASAWNAPTGNAPMYRSYAPSTTALRYFPKLSVVMNQVNAKGELITSYARTIKFRLTARDGKLNGGGVTYNDTLTTVNILQTSAPFAITYPNVTGISWPALSTQTVTWNNGGTDLAPFNEQFVNIYLSTNSGSTFPFIIATGVANNGSYTFTVPNQISNTCRMWVEGATAGSIFFDINDKAFAITAPVGIAEVNSLNTLVSVYPNPAKDQLNVFLGNELKGLTTLIVMNVAGQVTHQTTFNKLSSESTLTLNIKDLASGMYFVKIENAAGVAEKKLIVE
jgi:hypothetical protein